MQISNTALQPNINMCCAWWYGSCYINYCMLFCCRWWQTETILKCTLKVLYHWYWIIFWRLICKPAALLMWIYWEVSTIVFILFIKLCYETCKLIVCCVGVYVNIIAWSDLCYWLCFTDNWLSGIDVYGQDSIKEWAWACHDEGKGTISLPSMFLCATDFSHMDAKTIHIFVHVSLLFRS